MKAHSKHPARNTPAGELPFYSDPMHVGGIVTGKIGPETRVLELEFDGFGRFVVIKSQVEQTVLNILVDSVGIQLIIAPHRAAGRS